MEISKLLRPHLLDIKPYSSARDAFEGEARVYLDANENAFGSALEDRWRRYPDPNQKALKRRIGEVKGVPAGNIFLGNGSDEAIDLLIRAFCNPGKDRIIITPPTFGMYEVSAHVNDVRVISVPLIAEDNYSLDLEGIMEAIEPGVKIIFLCSPNNPTGNQLDPGAIITILEKFQGVVVVDEAYIDFSSKPSLLSRLDEFWNLVVLQTFSKAWGLAAMRLGMAFGGKEIIEVLRHIKTPYNISGITQELAIQALDNHEKIVFFVNEIVAQREWLSNELNKLDIVKKVYPSDANFLFVMVEKGHEVYKKLLEKGVVVRDRSQAPHCVDCMRITVGTYEENMILLDSLREMGE